MMALQLRLSDRYFLKDPQSTELGTKIINASIALIDEIGFEAFTFRKLSDKIGSTEASIYRYFENKHRLLLYLIAWYWAWLEYRIEFETYNLSDPEEKLSRALQILTEKKEQDNSFPDIDEPALHRIIIAESDKSYLTKQVDQDNKDGLFKGYKSLCNRISEMVREINPEYPYSNSLISTALEASNQQVFFADHLPSLSDGSNTEDVYGFNYQFIRSMVFNSIKA